VPLPPPAGTADVPPVTVTPHRWIDVGATLTLDELPQPPAAASTPHMAKTVTWTDGCQGWANPEE